MTKQLEPRVSRPHDRNARADIADASQAATSDNFISAWPGTPARASARPALYNAWKCLFLLQDASETFYVCISFVEHVTPFPHDIIKDVIYLSGFIVLSLSLFFLFFFLTLTFTRGSNFAN